METIIALVKLAALACLVALLVTFSVCFLGQLLHDAAVGRKLRQADELHDYLLRCFDELQPPPVVYRYLNSAIPAYVDVFWQADLGSFSLLRRIEKSRRRVAFDCINFCVSRHRALDIDSIRLERDLVQFAIRVLMELPATGVKKGSPDHISPGKKEAELRRFQMLLSLAEEALKNEIPAGAK